MSSLIGNRYGEAFFEAGRDENCLDSLYDDVCLLRVCSVKMRIS